MRELWTYTFVFTNPQSVKMKITIQDLLDKAKSMIEMQGVSQDSDSILDFPVTLWNVAIIIV